MKFVVSSSELLSHLQAISKVISSKNTLPILDNFLFHLSDNELTITASDLETTLITNLVLENTEGEGKIAIEAKRLADTLKEFSDQPLTFDVDLEDTMSVNIITETGKFSFIGQDADEFPQLPTVESDLSSIKVSSNLLLTGISKALFATADDELRPVMNGIYVEMTEEYLSFVASDAHKLVKYKRNDVRSENESTFILPKKPASLLKSILGKNNDEITLAFDSKNAYFTLPKYKLICRLVEGKYPNYNTVIPQDNPHKLIVDRLDFYNTVKRVQVFSNQASNLVKLRLTSDQVIISAQDIDFSISAYEKINCQYDGEEMEIGFKSAFLLEILNNLSSAEVVVELGDAARAGILLPLEKESDAEEELMLLMPMMINS